jgi:hypothetical protein
MACGDDDPELPDDERVRQIAGVAELAANAYAAAGPVGLYDYLAPQVTDRCSKQNLVAALEDQDIPDGFRRLASVEFDGNEAAARVVQLFGDEERATEWVFASLSENVWRLIDVPGLAGCRN